MKTARRDQWRERKVFDLGSDTSVYYIFLIPRVPRAVRRAQKKSVRRLAKREISIEVEEMQNE